ncbi:MAG TPA: putative PEP-binding protein [Actinomycetes bacterium]
MSRAYEAAGCAPGVALAPAWRPRRPSDVEPPVAGDVVAGVEEVAAAVHAVVGRLRALAASYRRDGATVSAEILEVEALIAADPTFLDDVVALAGDTSVPASTAATQVADRHAAVLEALESPELRERAADVRHVGRLVSDQLSGRTPLAPPAGPFVLLADEVTAPELLEHADRVVGAVSVRGGATSHASIVARSLGLPLVSLVPVAAVDVEDGVSVLVDGDAGRVVVAPGRETARRALTRTADDGVAARGLPARTRDGVDLTLLANVASAVEARRALDAGAAGVGLLRTELPFLDAADWPTRDEHIRRLAPVLEVLAGRPVTVRLLDFSNDKTPPFLAGRDPAASLANFLGDTAALTAQLSALASAGTGVELRVMVPMATRATDLVRVRHHLVDAVAGGVLPRVGAMVESPEAVANLPELLDVCDFVAIGTNDLTASTLGLARTDPALVTFRSADPAVLRLVEHVVLAAAGADVPVSVCGDAAADPAVLPLLIGAGVRAVSVAPSRLDAVRTLVRASSAADCRARLRAVLDGDDGVRRRVRSGVVGGRHA